MPGGNTRLTVHVDPFPLYARSGRGVFVTDVEGVERVDFLNNFGVLIHGHAHPKITEAICNAAAGGTSFGMPTPAEVELAETICSRNGTFERIRFCNSGTEAVMMAVQAARAFTRRGRIAKCVGAYHGGYDSVAVGQSSLRDGQVVTLPGLSPAIAEHTVLIPFNDTDAAVAALLENKEDLAAVVVDPLPYRLDLVPAEPSYLSALREVCAAHEILFVADEVSSFRIGYHGASAEFGIDADVTVIGKVMGGGMPVGAVTGRSDVLAVFDPTGGEPLVPHAGAFNANAVTMAAGLASMTLLTQDAIGHVNSLGDEVRRGLEEVLRRRDLPWRVAGMGSFFRVHLPGREIATRLYGSLLSNGIVVAPNCSGSISTPMDRSHVALLLSAFEKSLTELAV
ncbi:MAG: aminotransferase class III-fold pyridoxal phosphate-dependent enzyme [Actinomycetota bacterium]|nr:aminotransferase class III-fold pyridoxal phosphate-dependent enzyme [Actinomycetota bacterium]